MMNYINENEKDFTVSLPLNGVKKDEISMEIEKDTLYIEAKRNIEIPEGFKPLHKEFETEKDLKFSFVIGEEIDQNNINAKMDNGLLTLTMMKKEEALPKKINIA